MEKAFLDAERFDDLIVLHNAIEFIDDMKCSDGPVDEKVLAHI